MTESTERSILIAEDSATQAMQLQLFLERHDYQVRWAKSGVEAMAAIAQARPHLIISDVIMPDMNGYELCRQVKNDPELADIPLILLTTLSQPDDILEGLECGADNFLSKPYTEDDLISRVRYMIINSAMRRERQSADVGLEIYFAGSRRFINSQRIQILDHLFSAYESTVSQNRALEETNRQLTRLHEELERRNREQAALNEEKNRIIGIAAHDLRNPLGVINAYSRFLLGHWGQGKGDTTRLASSQKEMVERIQASSEFMLRLVNSLLDLSQIESGQLQLEREAVDLRTVLENHVALSSVLWEAKQIDLQLHCGTLPATVDIDPVKFEQVMSNLISNAVKFSPAGSTVTVTAQATPDQLEIQVLDNGPGISEELMQRIFEPFERGANAATAGEKSTGLGLAIAQRIIRGHGGELTASPRPNQGSVFKIVLPLQAQDAPEPVSA